jgi:hypothetical protein
MRRKLFLASLLALTLVLPAAARQQFGETVTLKVGQTVPLKTAFDKETTYTIIVSGLVTLSPTAACVNCTPSTYDPFHGVQAQNCEKDGGGVGVNFQIKDRRGDTINASDAYKPPVYTIPCRKDHTYAFQLNDAYPPSWDIDGRAIAYIPLRPDPTYWTASGSFKLQIKEGLPPRLDVNFYVAAKKELVASDDPKLADALLRGSGTIVDIDGDTQPRGKLSLTLVWLLRDDARIVLRPTDERWRYDKAKRSLFGYFEVVKSDEPTCERGAQWAVLLVRGRTNDAAVLRASQCKGLTKLVWREPSSAVITKIIESKVR